MNGTLKFYNDRLEQSIENANQQGKPDITDMLRYMETRTDTLNFKIEFKNIGGNALVLVWLNTRIIGFVKKTYKQTKFTTYLTRYHIEADSYKVRKAIYENSLNKELKDDYIEKIKCLRHRPKKHIYDCIQLIQKFYFEEMRKDFMKMYDVDFEWEKKWKE